MFGVLRTFFADGGGVLKTDEGDAGMERFLAERRRTGVVFSLLGDLIGVRTSSLARGRLVIGMVTSISVRSIGIA